MKQSKAKEELKKVIELFQNGEIGEYIALSYFPIPNIPCSKWSLTQLSRFIKRKSFLKISI